MTKKISFDLGGKICVITGGASGIGLAAAKLMAAHACKLVLLDLNWDALNTVKQSLDQCSESPVDIFQLDVCDPVKVKALAEKIEASIGTPDILINSAGIARLNNALETPIEEWRLVMDVNVNGTFYVSQAFGHYMVKRKSGSVINLGSMSGTIINRPQAATSYMASKGAVHQLTRALAVEWAEYGVRVNALAPGYVGTEMTLAMREQPELFNVWMEMTPMKRCGTPEEIANLIAFLASDAASYITGSIIPIDGGYTCW